MLLWVAERQHVDPACINNITAQQLTSTDRQNINNLSQITLGCVCFRELGSKVYSKCLTNENVTLKNKLKLLLLIRLQLFLPSLYSEKKERNVLMNTILLLNGHKMIIKTITSVWSFQIVFVCVCVYNIIHIYIRFF